MLRELHISDLAVIQDLTIELTDGLNCFTGQTGAGKSLILGAIEILLGLRAGSQVDMIRPGATEARVSGVFEVHDPWLAQQISRAADLNLAPGDDLLIIRRLFASGRTSTTLNGQPAAASMIRDVAEWLVDIHGQHDHQFLLKPSNQLLILDQFAQTMPLREQFSRLYGQWRQLQDRRKELASSRSLRRQQRDLYEFQAQEIDKVSPKTGELPQLKARHRLLTNLQRIQREAGSAYAALHESEGSVIERLQAVVHVLGNMTDLDQRLAPVLEQIRNATAQLQDASFDLGRYVQRLELDPAELAENEERLNQLNRLVSKYADAGTSAEAVGDDPIAAVLIYREQVEKELAQLRGQDQDWEGMDNQIKAVHQEMLKLGAELSMKRQTAGQRLKPLVEAQLRDLGMADAQLHLEFAPVDSAEESGISGIGACGMESLEMMVRTNPGQPARPLRKIASGGEMSRLMLAIKSIIASSDRVSVLVFDEIDANIGGRMGTVIGLKLRQLSRSGQGEVKDRKDARRQQVLCITHLPQIAAYADLHLRIAKDVVGKGRDKQTVTRVDQLDQSARIEELAEMLAGKDVSQTTRRQARELLDSAGQQK